MLSYPGYILTLLGIVICLFAVVIPIIRAYTNDERGIGMIFAIFKNRPWLILAAIGIVIITIGQALLGKF